MKRVILYGPLSKNISGGFDRMNNNTFELFKSDEDFEILKMPMLKMKFRGILKILFYPFFYLISFFYSFFMLIYFKISYRADILHITAVTTFLYRDIFILFIAKLLQIKIVYDIRAGLFIQNYKDFKKRFIYNLCFKLSSIILVEGKKYIPFLDSKGFKSTYLPNYTTININQKVNPYKFDKKLKFIYIGRVIKSKGIEDSIRILKRLNEKYRINLQFVIIGEYDPNYISKLNNEFKGFMENVTFTGYMDKNKIDNFLLNADFFMFLSSWIGEGHSNALNEAMSYSIPLFFYNQGFTREIIDNDSFMLNNLNSLKSGNCSYGNKTIYNNDILEDSVDRIYNIIKDEKFVNSEKERLKILVREVYSLDKLKPYLKKIYTLK